MQMKRRMIISSLIFGMICLLSLTSCISKKEKSEKIPYGRYVERNGEMELRETGIVVKQLCGEQVKPYLSGRTDEIFDQINLGVELKGEYNYPKECMRIIRVIIKDAHTYTCYLSKDGKIMVERTGSTNTTFVVLQDQLQHVDGDELRAISFDMDGEGNYYLMIGGKLSVYSQYSGKIKYTYPETYKQIEIVDRKVYAMTKETQEIKIYDANTYQVIKTILYVMEQGDQVFTVDTEDNSIYLVGHKGIKHHLYQGNLWEEVIPYEHTSLAMVNYEIKGACVKNESFYVCFTDEVGNIQFKVYTYEEGATLETKTTMHIVMSEENDLVRQAAATYQIQNPQVDIEWQVLEGSMEEKNNALRTILSQKPAPDLVVLDGLPISEYIKQGYIEDVTDMITPKMESEKWFYPVIDHYKVDGRYYVVPMRFSIPMIWGEKEVVAQCSSLEDLAAYKLAHPDTILLGKSMPELVAQTAQSSMPFLVDEKGHFSRTKCMQYLDTLKVICERENDEVSQPCMSISGGKEKHEEMLCTAFNDTKAFLFEPCLVEDFVWAEMAMEKRKDGCIAALQIEGKTLFATKGLLGVCLKGENRKEAKEIMGMALGRQVESEEHFLGMPIGKVAMEKQAFYNRTEGKSIIDGQGRKLVALRPFGILYYELQKQSETVEICVTDEGYMRLYERIYPYLLAYAKGEMTKDEALDKMEKVD